MAIAESTRVRTSPHAELAPARTPFPALTLEITLYAALGIFALVIRLFLLDYAPLSSDEAQQAISAWYFLNGLSFDHTGSPLLFAGDILLFLLFGAHDLTPRLIPAVFGSALVLVPSLLRRELGQTGALIASALLVFSPTLVFFSRSGDAAIVAISCALAALVLAWRYGQDRTPAAIYLAAALTALALLASPDVWTIVAVTVAFFLISVVRSRYFHSPSAFIALTATGPLEYRHLKWAGGLFLLVFFGVSTVFLLHREGAGAALDLFGGWLNSLPISGSPFELLRLLAIYEPLALFLGFAAVIHLFFDLPRGSASTPVLWFLSIWAIGAFFLYSLAGDKDPSRLVVLIVPLILLVGWYIGDWVSDLRNDLEQEPDAGMLVFSQYLPVFLFGLALAAFLYFVMAEFSTRGSVLAAELVAAITRAPLTASLNAAVLTALIAIATAAVGFLTVTTLGWGRAKHVIIALALTLLSLWTIRQLALTSFSGEWNPREWLVTRAASSNVRSLVTDLEGLSRWRANDTRTITILADESLGPVTRWYLRNFVNTEFVSHPVMGPGIQALLVPPSAPVNSAGMMSQRYRLESTRSPAPDSDFFKWLLFRRSGELVYSDAVLYLSPSNQ